MLATQYSYSLDQQDGLIVVSLVKVATSEIKKFPMVAKSLPGIINHMENMSDDCCAGFFPKQK